MAPKRICFFVMPFRPELNFVYLYLQRYLEDRHGLTVRRGDTSVLTKALMDKVETEIRAADVIVGDITDANPNVFYELGIARALGKPVLFMTQQAPESAPVDLRQFEFIHYDLAREHELLTRLDNAIGHILGQGYEGLFDDAVELLRQFNAQTGSNYLATSAEEFQARVIRGERLEGIPEREEAAYPEFLLPKIVAESTDIGVIRKMDRWLSDAA
ncbi:MAG: hypothetical protein KDH15_02030 [Rhodocyclaceae bacterium]|nr:hypothetical protein [Rhodocyclaceae bacterium]